jgi:hypothetical protein
MTRAEAAKTQGHCNRRRVRRGACPLGIYPCDRSFESIPRIKCARPATCSWLMHAAKNGRRRGASPFDRQSALGTPLHPPRHRIFRAARPGSFAAPYVIGIPTDGLFGARVPSGSARPGWTPVHNLASVILNEGRVMGNRGVGDDGWKVFCGVVGKNRGPEPGSTRPGSCQRC